jgi:hypothetical protein
MNIIHVFDRTGTRKIQQGPGPFCRDKDPCRNYFLPTARFGDKIYQGKLMAILSKDTWERHSNPWSGWTRLATYPAIFIAIWFHNWLFFAVLFLWLVVNPSVFPKPKNTANWMSRAVLGEQLWMGKKQLDLSAAVSACAAPPFFIGLYTAYVNLLWPTVFCATITILLKLWFLDRMVFYYEAHERTENNKMGD